MADSIERRQNGPAVEAQAATPSIVEGPRMYVGGGRWVSVEMPLVERLSKPQRGEILDHQSFDGVDTGSYTASWGSQNLAGLFAETEERTAARLALDESARRRRSEAREVRLGRVARALHLESPEDVTDVLGKSKAKKWSTGASKGKVSALRPTLQERRHVEEQLDGEPMSSRAHLRARTETAIIDFEATFPADQIAPINDADRYHATFNGTEVEEVSLKDRVAIQRTVELGKPKDQDPDRRGRMVTKGPKRTRTSELVFRGESERIGWESRWISLPQTRMPWKPRPVISESEHIEESRGDEEVAADSVGLGRLAERDQRIELIGTVKDMISVGWTRERIQQEISVFEEIGSFEIKPGYGFKEVMVGYENLSAWIWEENGREVWFDNGRWGYVDEEFDRWHDEALNGRHYVTDGQIEDFYDSETYEGEEEGFNDVDWEDEIIDAPAAEDRSESVPVFIDVLAEVDDMSAVAQRGENEIVSAEKLAAQETRDLDITERRESRAAAFEEALTVEDQDS